MSILLNFICTCWRLWNWFHIVAANKVDITILKKTVN